MNRPPKTILVCAPFLAAVICLLIMNPFYSETPLDRAYRICKNCGLYPIEIDELIQHVKESGLTPAESVKLWTQSAEPGAVELCRECVDAVIEAAE